MADILYTCSSCPQHLSADDDHIGGRVTCPRCGHGNEIPAAVAEAVCGTCQTLVKIAASARGESFKCPGCAGEIHLPLPWERIEALPAKSDAAPTGFVIRSRSPAALLAVQDVSLVLAPAQQQLLHEVTLELPGRHLAAIVGPSGCGKTTLLKAIAGIREPTAGVIAWQGRDLAVEDLAPTEIGYVPQFSILYEHLTIHESMDAALRLRVAGLDAAARRERSTAILQRVGLLGIADRQVRVLSGGERRRLTLAVESVTQPKLLLCDEVTSGLDPKAEEEVVELMRQLARDGDRLVISVTHNLRLLNRYDSVAVLYEGHLVYHGPSGRVAEYFGVLEVAETFGKLAHRPVAAWHTEWQRRRADFPLPAREDVAAKTPTGRGGDAAPTSSVKETPAATPNALVQLAVLLQRRGRIFLRDRGQLLLHAVLLFGFPCLVVIFALNGLPQMQRLSMGLEVSPLQQLRETTGYLIEASRVGGLVSGLVMFQVILLALMGSNNAAREVAAERLIFEKEKLSGLRPVSYLASKVMFLAGLVAAQSLWMAVFVNFIGRFPGELALQCWLLLLGNAAITAVSLGISSLLKSPEQASLVSIYLVGFQIPLSGAFLALPAMLGTVTRPFIAAYWSWSGVVATMRDTRFYDAVQLVTQTELAGTALCLWALASHVVLGVVLAYLGCRRSRWE